MNLADEESIKEEYVNSIKSKHDRNTKGYNPKIYINSPFTQLEAEIHIEKNYLNLNGSCKKKAKRKTWAGKIKSASTNTNTPS